MLATIAMALVGASVLYFGSRRDAGPVFEADVSALRRDLSVFLVGYTLAVVAALVASRTVRVAIALGLVLLFVSHVGSSGSVPPATDRHARCLDSSQRRPA